MPLVPEIDIKHHLLTKGSKPLYTTTSGIRFWWRQLNTVVFSGELTPFEFITNIHNSSQYHAMISFYDHEPARLDISPYFETKTLFLDVLVHEMVHAWEYTNGCFEKPYHGTRFMSWKERIYEATSLTLQTKY